MARPIPTNRRWHGEPYRVVRSASRTPRARLRASRDPEWQTRRAVYTITALVLCVLILALTVVLILTRKVVLAIPLAWLMRAVIRV